MEGTAGFIAQDVPGGMQSSIYSGGYAVVSVGLGKENRRRPGEKYEILKSILPRGLADELSVLGRSTRPDRESVGLSRLEAGLMP